MKKIIFSILSFILLISQSFADEGMWLPMLIGQKNYDQMTKLGLKLTPQQLYDINNASVKDAIIWFGGGCTGEVISNEGLILTNHHCGYGSIADLSTAEDNILNKGFWAKSKQEERPAKGLSVAFLIRMEDVTDKMLSALSKYPADSQLYYMQKEAEAIVKPIQENGKYEVFIRDMFKGNQFYMFVMERYTDIRLVGTPPESIGKFGGDTDNWMWPRHTGDFSIFRIYANKDNKPSAYNKDNVPYKPKHHLPVSIKDINNGDFAMIYGFPGRTNRYETSMGVKLALEQTNPAIVKLRTRRLELMKKQMDQDVNVRIQLASRYAQIANYWKYYIGQSEQLKKNKVLERKLSEEAEFKSWATNNPTYANIFNDLEKEYEIYQKYNLHGVYITEGIRGSSLISLGTMFLSLEEELSKPNPDTALVSKLSKSLKGYYYNVFLKNFNMASDKEIIAYTMEAFYRDIDDGQWPEIYNMIVKKTKEDKLTEAFEKYTNLMMKKTMLLDSNKLMSFFEKPNLKFIKKDIVIQYALSFIKNYNKNYKKYSDQFNSANYTFANKYLKGLMQKSPNKYFYPDANSTMRVTYGTVKDYDPRDAVHFSYYTTLKGIMEKEDPNNEEFIVPVKLKELYKNKDFGQYVNKNGEVPVAFITTNDITGGNSGSPVMNANGELIGTAFDGNWEAMSGDIAFDENLKRTICVDIRYTLFIIEKLGGASNLISELTIKK